MQVRISVGYLYGRCPNAEGLARQKREAYAITELISEKKKNKKTPKSKHPIRKKKKKRENPNPPGSAARDHGRSSPKWKPSCGQTRDQTRDQIW